MANFNENRANFGLSEFRLVSFELDRAEQLAAEMRRLGEQENDATCVYLSCHTNGLSHAYRGEFSRSRVHFEDGLQYPPPPIVATYARIGTLMNLARVLLFLGHLDQARARYDEGLALARKSNPFSLTLGLTLALHWLPQLRLYDDLIVLANELLALSRAQGFKLFEAAAIIARGHSLAMKGRTEEGIAEIVAGQQVGRPLLGFEWPPTLLALAESLGRAGQAEEGLKQIDEVEQTRRQYRESQVEIHRVRARLQLMLGESDAAEENLQMAIAVAQGQRAKFLELLAAMELAQLWSAQGKAERARDLLAPIYGWFTEGLDLPIIKEAKALLDKLGGDSTAR